MITLIFGLKIDKILILCFSVILLLSVIFSPIALAVDSENGAKIFSVQCVGCHPGGGNIIRRGKTLKQKALKQNHLDALETISTFIANGKNNMPAYKEKLTQAEIQEVAHYVLEQAEKNWR